MSSRMNSHERQITTTFNLSNLPPIFAESQVLELDLIVGVFPRPIKRFGPCVVSQPVADEVRVTLRVRISIIECSATSREKNQETLTA